MVYTSHRFNYDYVRISTMTLEYVCGVSDYFFKNSKKDKRNKPPLWCITDEQLKDWQDGYNHAKSLDKPL